MSTPPRPRSSRRAATCCCGSHRPSTFVSTGFARAARASSRPRDSISDSASSRERQRTFSTRAPSRIMTRQLPANRAHGARRLDEARLADMVLQLLAPDRVAYQRRQLRVRSAGAQRLAQIGLVHREEARAQLALGSQADAVAVRAERLRHGIDEADLAVAVGEAEHPRRGRRLARQLLERM